MAARAVRFKGQYPGSRLRIQGTRYHVQLVASATDPDAPGYLVATGEQISGIETYRPNGSGVVTMTLYSNILGSAGAADITPANTYWKVTIEERARPAVVVEIQVPNTPVPVAGYYDPYAILRTAPVGP